MGYYKNLDIRIRSGGDDAVAAALEMTPRWIPVSERLPEPDGDYLVSLNDTPRTKMVMYFYRDGDDGKWSDDWGRAKLITHWMPLPEPPA